LENNGGGGHNSIGVFAAGVNTSLKNVYVKASGGAGSSLAIFSQSGSLNADNVTAEGYAGGFNIYSGGTARIVNSTGRIATNYSGDIYVKNCNVGFINNFYSNMTIDSSTSNTQVTMPGWYSIVTSGTDATVTITNSVFTDPIANYATLKIANTQLGTTPINGGVIKCFNVFDVDLNPISCN
jgi:hypothetical protein